MDIWPQSQYHSLHCPFIPISSVDPGCCLLPAVTGTSSQLATACQRFHLPFVIIPWCLISLFASTSPAYSVIISITFHTWLLRMKYIIYYYISTRQKKGPTLCTQNEQATSAVVPLAHSMEVSIVDAALPIEYSWDCPYIQQIFHGKIIGGNCEL